MNRRQLLLGTATMLVAAVPFTTAAASIAANPTTALQNKIQRALHFAETCRFSLSEKATLFGIYPYAINSLAELQAGIHAWAVDFGSRDMQGRVDMLLAIQANLDNKFGPRSIAARHSWMTQQPISNGKSLRQLMLRPHYMDLHYALRMLEETV